MSPSPLSYSMFINVKAFFPPGISSVNNVIGKLKLIALFSPVGDWWQGPACMDGPELSPYPPVAY